MERGQTDEVSLAGYDGVGSDTVTWLMLLGYKTPWGICHCSGEGRFSERVAWYCRGTDKAPRQVSSLSGGQWMEGMTPQPSATEPVLQSDIDDALKTSLTRDGRLLLMASRCRLAHAANPAYATAFGEPALGSFPPVGGNDAREDNRWTSNSSLRNAPDQPVTSTLPKLLVLSARKIAVVESAWCRGTRSFRGRLHDMPIDLRRQGLPVSGSLAVTPPSVQSLRVCRICACSVRSICLALPAAVVTMLGGEGAAHTSLFSPNLLDGTCTTNPCRSDAPYQQLESGPCRSISRSLLSKVSTNVWPRSLADLPALPLGAPREVKWASRPRPVQSPFSCGNRNSVLAYRVLRPVFQANSWKRVCIMFSPALKNALARARMGGAASCVNTCGCPYGEHMTVHMFHSSAPVPMLVAGLRCRSQAVARNSCTSFQRVQICLSKRCRSHPWARFKYRLHSVLLRRYRRRKMPMQRLRRLRRMGMQIKRALQWLHRSTLLHLLSTPQASLLSCLPNPPPSSTRMRATSKVGWLARSWGICNVRKRSQLCSPSLAQAMGASSTPEVTSPTDNAGTSDTHNSFSPNTLSRSGPKSGGACLRLLLIIQRLVPTQSVLQATQAGTNTRVVGPHTIDWSQTGKMIPYSASPTKHSAWCLSQFTHARKRAYKRACHRACANPDGGTFYRGRWCTKENLRASYVGSASPSPQRSSVRTSDTAKRLRLVSLNTGPLSTASYDELMLWLTEERASLDVAIFLECGWSQDTEYTTSHWHVIYTGAAQKGQGVMICVNASLCAQSDIRWAPIVPGRLLHVRVTPPRLGCSLDICGVYQHVWNTKGGRDSLLRRRDEVWQKLTTLVAQIPQRNTLLCAGDFNATLSPSQGWVGPAVQPPQAPPSDCDSFQRLVETYDLLATNTWLKLCKAYTFASHNGRTQIDYVLCRRACADHTARLAAPDHASKLFAWQKGGRHFPVWASLPLRCYHGTSRRQVQQSACPSIDKAALIAAVQRNTPQAVSLRGKVQELLWIKQPSTPEALNACLLEATEDEFPLRTKVSVPKAWHCSTIQATIRTMWGHYRKARLVQRQQTLGSAFKAWVHLSRFRSMRKTLLAQGRAKRRQMYKDQVAQASVAANRGDQKTLFQIIRRLAPKATRQRVQLRSTEGGMLTEDAELAVYVKHCEELFDTHAASVSADSSLEAPIVFEAEDLSKAILALNINKAVPGSSAPVAVWHLCSEELSVWLSKWVREHWRGIPEIPALWADAWITWMLKPGRVPRTPQDLRPLALQDCGGKAVAKHLQTVLRPCVSTLLSDLPQFAYLPGRSLETALARVTSVCARIRDDLRGAAAPLYKRKQGSRPSLCTGGLIFTCDMSQAFDRARREDVCEALRIAGVPADLVTLIAHFHNDIRYHLRVGRQSAAVRCGRGVRQGCMIAPLLWDALTGLILERLRLRMGKAWVDEFLTMFADDLISVWELTGPARLHRAIEGIKVIIQTLRAFGMRINSSKSSVVIDVRGHIAKMWRRKHVRSSPTGPVLRLNLSSDEVMCLPVRHEVPYLGVIVSFQGFENASLKRRVQAAEANRCRLQKLLQGRHALTLKQRVQLWRACVLSSLVHGLSTVGLSRSGAKSLCTRVVRHLRGLSSSPVHLTGESNTALLARLGVPHPIQDLIGANERLLKRHCMSGDIMVAHPLVLKRFTDVCASLHQLMQQDPLQAVVHTHHPEVPRATDGTMLEGPINCAEDVVPASFVCDVCYLAFGSLAMLRKHYVQCHGQSLQMTTGVFDRWAHSLQGMPTCRHCSHVFGGWGDLQRHIQGGHCSSLWRKVTQGFSSPTIDGAMPAPPGLGNASLVSADTEGAAHVPLLYRAHFAEALSQQGWLQVLTDTNIATELSHHCGICGQWVVDSQHLKIHLRRIHHEVWAQHAGPAKQLCRVVARSVVSPCRWCGSKTQRPVQHAHRCAVVFQVCLMASLRGHIHGECRGRAALVRWLHVRPAAGSSAACCPGNTSSASPSTGSCIPNDASSISKLNGYSPAAGAHAASNSPHATGGTWQASPSRPTSTRAGSLTTAPSEHPPAATTGTGPDTPRPAVSPRDRLALAFQRGSVLAAKWRAGSCSNGGSPDTETGGPSAEDGAGYDVCVELQKCSVGGLDSSTALSGHHGVAAAVRDGPCSASYATSHHGSSLCTGTAGGAARIPDGRCSENSGHEKARLADEQRRLGLHEMGLHHRDLGDGQSVCSDVAGSLPRRFEGGEGSPRALARGPVAQVPSNSQAGEPHDGAGGFVHLRSLLEAHIGRRSVLPSEAVDWTCLASLGRSTAQGSSAQEECSRAVHPECSFKALLKQVLRNPSNLCYLHTVVISFAWCFSYCAGDAAGFLGERWEAIRHLFQPATCPILLPSFLSWRLLLQGWSDLQSQHDAAEFAEYFLDRFQHSLTSGEWEARTPTESAYHVHDRGSNQLLLLPVAAGCQSFQDCVSQWATQAVAVSDETSMHLLPGAATTHALLAPPPVFLLVQLKRFANSDAGTSKVFHPVCMEAGQRYAFPVYTAEGSIIFADYHIISVVFHLGDSTTNGHYRSVLHYPIAGQWRSWVSDDGKPAVVLTPEMEKIVECNNYLVWLRKAD